MVNQAMPGGGRDQWFNRRWGARDDTMVAAGLHMQTQDSGTITITASGMGGGANQPAFGVAGIAAATAPDPSSLWLAVAAVIGVSTLA
jgi:hypothetical protein